MKRLRLIQGCLALTLAVGVSAQEKQCDLHLMAFVAPQEKTIPESVSNLLFNKLCTAISGADVYADADYSRFFVSAKVSTLFKEELPGPPISTAVTISVRLYVGDYFGEKVFDTAELELKGAGTSTERAYINALRGLKSGNVKIKQLIVNGKSKIIDYYDHNYKRLLAKAQQCASMKQDAEALFYISSIPECCVGYADASRMTLNYYKQYIDNNCQKLVTRARTAWMQSPDGIGAEEVADCLNQIDPDAACYSDAMALYKEVKETMKNNWAFEMRQKYSDALTVEKQKIEAARAVGVAFGNGQKPQTTNIMWLK